ncbi:MAG: DNA repair protein RecN [Oscillospiraceae bacterium]|jgi:DNA repair protein RecN (Recombination protein N)|nr:DNA repair protein RecN [Oscillospiraceae bacterium]
MLKELYIENLAVIEKAAMNFCPGFNVFTGETGAGKSILIGAVKAILGGRVSKDLVRSGAQRAQVSAVFTDINEKACRRLTEYGFADSADYAALREEPLLLTREIGADGKSSARINNKPATAAALRDIAAELIDIHGQHDSHTLTDNARQRDLLDNFGRLSAILGDYAVVFRDFSELSRKLKQLQADEDSKEEKAALLKEKLSDVNSYKLTRGEEAETASRLAALRNAKAIKQNILLARSFLSDDSSTIAGVTDLISRCRACLSEIAEFLPDCGDLLKRLESAEIELDDIRGEVAALDSADFDPEQTARLEERMSDLLRLKRKYRLDIDELVEESKKWRDELAELEYSEDMTEKLAAERKKAGDNLKRLAGEITAKRTKAADELAAKITEELIYLDMPNVQLFFALSQEKVTVSGMDGVEIMISVNKGEEPKPLAKIASGGELSRIMLAIKAVLAQSDSIPAMIFDEIDSGISGRAAQKVGAKLAGIAERRQVLCVTHIASIAAKADKHLLIEKSDDGERTYTRVSDLDLESRKQELARIISGDGKLMIDNEQLTINIRA